MHVISEAAVEALFNLKLRRSGNFRCAQQNHLVTEASRVERPELSQECLDRAAIHIGAGQIRQHAARNGKNLARRTVPDLIDHRRLFVIQIFMPFRFERADRIAGPLYHCVALTIGILARAGQHLFPLSFAFRRIQAHLLQASIDFLILPRRFGELIRDTLFARIDCVHQPAVEEMFQQGDQDQKVDDLRDDSEPVDQHGYLGGTTVTTWFQKGFAKIRMMAMTKQ